MNQPETRDQALDLESPGYEQAGAELPRVYVRHACVMIVGGWDAVRRFAY